MTVNIGLCGIPMLRGRLPRPRLLPVGVMIATAVGLMGAQLAVTMMGATVGRAAVLEDHLQRHRHGLLPVVLLTAPVMMTSRLIMDLLSSMVAGGL